MAPAGSLLQKLQGRLNLFPNLFGGKKEHFPQRGINPNEALGADDLPSTWVTSNAYWNPNLETGTDKQGQYWDLHEALRDPQSAACLDLRCQIASSLPYELIAQEGTPPDALTLVNYVLENMDFPGMLEQMVKSTYYGLSAIELFWRNDDPAHPGKILPWDALPMDLQFVWFDQSRAVLINGREPEIGKLILATTGMHFRNPFGLGRGRTVPQWVRVKKAISWYTFRDYGSYCHDKIHFTYPDGDDEQEVAKYKKTAQAALNAPALVTKDEMKATPIRLESQFEQGVKLIDACDQQIAKAILGNTLTTGEGKHGTQALGAVHESMTDKQTWADGLRLQMVLNRTLIPWIVQANFPGAVPPKISFDATVKMDDLKAMQVLIGAASFQDKDGKSLQISGSWLRDKFNIPEPDMDVDNDALHLGLAPPAPPVAPKAPALPPLKEPSTPALAASKKTRDEKHAESVLDRWEAQWRERIAGPHRLIMAALGDGK